MSDVEGCKSGFEEARVSFLDNGIGFFLFLAVLVPGRTFETVVRSGQVLSLFL